MSPRPIVERKELPRSPFDIAGLPPATTIRRGWLLWYVGERRRPFVMVGVMCPFCERVHAYPWMWTWGAGHDIAMLYAARCRQGPMWVALDPAKATENADVHQRAREAYLEWKRERDEATAERQARRVSAATRPTMIPLWCPPAGSPPLASEDTTS